MRIGTCIVIKRLLRIVVVCAPGLAVGEALTLQQAIAAAKENNRAIHSACMEHARQPVWLPRCDVVEDHLANNVDKW